MSFWLQEQEAFSLCEKQNKTKQKKHQKAKIKIKKGLLQQPEGHLQTKGVCASLAPVDEGDSTPLVTLLHVALMVWSCVCLEQPESPTRLCHKGDSLPACTRGLLWQIQPPSKHGNSKLRQIWGPGGSWIELIRRDRALLIKSLSPGST